MGRKQNSSGQKISTPIVVVTGPSGSGKSLLVEHIKKLVGGQLAKSIASLDKDDYEEKLNEKMKPGEVDTEEYKATKKQKVYAGLIEEARLASIDPKVSLVVLQAPFTGQTHDINKWNEMKEALGNGPILLVWMQSDREKLAKNFKARNPDPEKPRHQDAWKLKSKENFTNWLENESKYEEQPPKEMKPLIVLNNSDVKDEKDLEEKVKEFCQEKVLPLIRRIEKKRGIHRNKELRGLGGRHERLQPPAKRVIQRNPFKSGLGQ